MANDSPFLGSRTIDVLEFLHRRARGFHSSEVRIDLKTKKAALIRRIRNTTQKRTSNKKIESRQEIKISKLVGNLGTNVRRILRRDADGRGDLTGNVNICQGNDSVIVYFTIFENSAGVEIMRINFRPQHS